MKVGVPKEVKNREYRVALTPIGVHELVQHGHEVVVTATGYLARCLQHETDHLDGYVYLDRLVGRYRRAARHNGVSSAECDR